MRPAHGPASLLFRLPENAPSEANAITDSRGVEITDRAALEDIACECHEVSRQEFDRLL